MRRPWHGAMPVTVTLPLDLERRLSTRQRRWRRVAVGVLIGLGLALLAAGFWLPAQADLARQLANGAAPRGVTAPDSVTKAPRRGTRPGGRFALDGGGPLSVPAASLATLAIGDELVVERADGSASTYTVAALDVVDSRRAELVPDADESLVVLETRWPFEAVTVDGSWRYIVTARERF
jgi:hypothetical protein